ncbi:B3 domain-containing protein At1g05920-like [Salvia hispanica]|uniref:B3 domain-containing protein At1g05920-like n=1 Tax=Salvia hispanica TaxID=49212 RepID=UPI002009333D|nr:B3 domain-containing protein At1g05920-like [Salvia hispanica]
MGFRDLTLKDVEDLFTIEGDKLDVLAATAQCAIQLRDAVEETPPPAAAESSSSAAGRSERQNSPHHDPPPPRLPEEFRRAIEEMARGKELTAPATLVIQKELFRTDVSKNHNRLSIPASQISDGFLTEEERRRLGARRKGRVDVRVVEASGEAVAAKLCRWVMAKGEGRKRKRKTTSCSYVINGAWNEIVERNVLELGMEVQLWCFRIDGELCFLVVPLPANPGVAGPDAGDGA